MKILMPKGLKIDQFVALALLLEVLKVKFADVTFFFHDLDQDVPEDAVDLDARMHYKRGHNLSSATEVVAKAYGVTDVGPLLAELARNNGTGFMRGGDSSFALIAQKVYDLRASTVPAREHQIDVLSHAVKVGEAYLRASRAGRLGAKKTADGFGFKPDASKRIHHLPGYVSFLVEEGKTDEAKAEFAWWKKKFTGAADAAERAEKRVEAMPELQAFEIGGLQVAQITANADEVAGQVFQRFQQLDVLVVLSSDSAAILPNFKGNADLRRMDQLHDALEVVEPGAWHLEKRGTSAMLLNGSARRDKAADSKICRDQERLHTLMAEAWK